MEKNFSEAPISAIKITAPRGALNGEVTLERSKSLSNRALVIRSLCSENFPIASLSEADDTLILAQLLRHETEVYDCGHGGTTFRFLTALLAFREGRQTLTGSARLCQRPIAPLVEALRKLGAAIEYIGREGYPPLSIGSPQKLPKDARLEIDAGISSQFVSALLMVAPTLPGGLDLHLVGHVASAAYIRMTTGLMAQFGVSVQTDGHWLRVPEKAYVPQAIDIEADWSGASYFFELAALAEEAELCLPGLRPESLQGDAVIEQLAATFGVKSKWEDGILHIKKAVRGHATFRHDFSECPDLAQTMIALCAGTGAPGVFEGLGTLAHKETDRTAAMQTELAKWDVDFFPEEGRRGVWHCRGSIATLDKTIRISTYEDHRMALSLSPLCMVSGEIIVANPSVVEKSFPAFWQQLKQFGFDITEI